MSKLLVVLKRLIKEHRIDDEPATIRLHRGLAIAYREIEDLLDQRWGNLTLSRVDNEPSKQEISIILAIVEKLEAEHSEPIIEELELVIDKHGREHKVIRIRWKWLDGEKMTD